MLSRSVDPLTGEIEDHASLPCPEDVTGSEQVTVGVLVTERIECGEVSAVWVNTGESVSGEGVSEWLSQDQCERDHWNAIRALSRAKTALRRFCTANLLVRMWTLTYADAQWDHQKVVADVNRFMGELRGLLGEAFPYAYVLELHPGGHGLHVHFLIQKRFVDYYRLKALWGHGHVQYSDSNRSLKRENGGRAQARMAANYLVKYCSKDWEYGSGRHRYERSQGFNARITRRLFANFEEAMLYIVTLRGDEPCRVYWDSAHMGDQWKGPPALWYAW